ncbi:MAG: hypothetical protein ACOC1S_01525 [bacterium]
MDLSKYSVGLGIIIGGGLGYLISSLTNISSGLAIFIGAIIGLILGFNA